MLTLVFFCWITFFTMQYTCFLQFYVKYNMLNSAGMTVNYTKESVLIFVYWLIGQNMYLFAFWHNFTCTSWSKCKANHLIVLSHVFFCLLLCAHGFNDGDTAKPLVVGKSYVSFHLRGNYVCILLEPLLLYVFSSPTVCSVCLLLWRVSITQVDKWRLIKMTDAEILIHAFVWFWQSSIAVRSCG